MSQGRYTLSIPHQSVFQHLAIDIQQMHSQLNVMERLGPLLSTWREIIYEVNFLNPFDYWLSCSQDIKFWDEFDVEIFGLHLMAKIACSKYEFRWISSAQVLNIIPQ